jgi:hypothetical protein
MPTSPLVHYVWFPNLCSDVLSDSQVKSKVLITMIVDGLKRCESGLGLI